MAPPTLLRSRKLIPAFTVHVPATVAEAVALKASDDSFAYLAGGIEVIDRLKHGAAHTGLIRLDRIEALSGIALDGNVLRIGAAVSHRDIAASQLMQQYLPGLADGVRGIGSPRIRFQGTIGGNVMSRAQHYDILPMLMALSARLIFVGGDGGVWETPSDATLPDSPHTLLQAISIPVQVIARNFAFERIDKPVISLAVAASAQSGNSRTVRVVLACIGRPPLLRELEIASASPQVIADAAAAWRASLPEIPDDRIASAWYRAELAQVRLRRVLTRLLGATP